MYTFEKNLLQTVIIKIKMNFIFKLPVDGSENGFPWDSDEVTRTILIGYLLSFGIFHNQIYNIGFRA